MDGSDDAHGAENLVHGLTGTRTGQREERIEKLQRWLWLHRWSVIFVWAPTIICALYYFLLAPDLYASEARFVVRAPSRMQAVGLSSLLQSTGIGRAQDDVFSVHDFIISRDAIAALEKQIDLRGLFNRPEADFFSRYPNLINDKRAEEFFRYYQRRVSVVYDSTTGISTLTVKAFRPEDAQLIATLLLRESEALVNRLNERAHNNAVRDAEIDVKLSEDRVTEAQQKVLAYRNRETMLDPGKASGAIFETVAKMQAELASTKTRIAELDRNSPGSPMRSNLETHVTALANQIDGLQGRLAGGDGSMAPKISEYEQLILRQDFAARELASAMGSLESAREEARRQNTYLDRVVEPSKPDKAEFPKRIKTVLTILVTCGLIYLIGKFLMAGVREHSQI